MGNTFKLRWQIGIAFCLLSLILIFFSKSGQPLIDQYSFRQTQTALTAYWFHWRSPIQSVFYSETPIFGFPWQVPFEFPLYQALVSGFSKVTCISISQSGRLVSLFMYILTIPLFASLAMSLKLGKRFIFVTSMLWVCCPLYLYWSRAFLIESTAVFFGFLFLALLDRSLNQKKYYLWLLTAFASAMCALVKATTYPSFALAALGVLILKNKKHNEKHTKQYKENLISLAYLTAVWLIALLLTAGWTRHADAIKQNNEITFLLTSKSLGAWNFGTWEKKLDPLTWENLFSRCIPEIIGSWWVLGGMMIGALFLRGSEVTKYIWFLILFLLPMFIFTNLHVVHSYYQYANGFWLIFALGLVITHLTIRMNSKKTSLIVVAISITQLGTYLKRYYPSLKASQSDTIEAGEFINHKSQIDANIIVVGDDWSPEIAFFSKRKCIYFPNWLSPDRIKVVFNKISEKSETTHGQKAPFFVVIHKDRFSFYKEQNKQLIMENLAKFLPEKLQASKIGGYEIYGL